jgi:hypothetical protein
MSRSKSLGVFATSHFFSLLLIALSFALCPLASAQSTAVLRGSVIDPSGAAVVHAKVVVRNQATGAEWNNESDSDGLFVVPALPPGTYAITVSAEGFQTAIVSNLVLDVSTTVTQTIQLQVGKLSQQVTITAESPVIDNSTVTIGQVVDQKTVQEIPLNGRHFLDLGFLTAGSVTAPANGFLSQPIRGQGSFAFNTAGQREDTVNIMVNGINLNDMVQNQLVFQPSINTVAEFKVDNSVPSAEYGRNVGAVVNIATRSGTNDFHGEAFEFLRNSDLDARNFFNTKGVPQSTLKRNNFGAALGGPIKKNRAHFFISYEGLRHRQGLTVNALVLNQAQLDQVAATSDATVKSLVQNFIPPGNFTDSKGNAFFRGSSVAPVNIDQGTADVDVQLTSSDRLHGYFALQQDLRQEPLFPTVGDTLPTWGDIRQSRRQIVTLSEDHIFGPSLTNTFRVGYSRIHITFTPAQLLNSGDFGIDSGVTSSIGLAELNIGGTGALDFGGPTGEPQGRGDTTFVIGDNLSWLKGRHALVFGIELRRFYNNNFSQDPSRFVFNSITDFINDAPASYTLGGFTANRILSPTYDWFVQDSFKWRSNVTLQLGLRYSWYSTPTEADNRFVVFDPGTDSLNQIGTPGFGQPFHTNNLNFQPRLGIVWDPFSNGKTVVRAGYGILTDEPITGIVTNLNANPPFAQPLTATPTAANMLSLMNASTVAGFSGLAPTTINRHFDNPYVQEWNLNIERQITPSLGLTAAYVGSEGTHLRVARNLNQFELESGADCATVSPCLVRPFPTLSAGSPIRPGAGLGNIIDADSPGTSSYNALWLTLNKRFSHGLQFNTSYTFSKSFDDVSQNNNTVLLQNSLDVRDARGLSDFDARHRFVLSGFYQLPFHSNRFVEGWQFGLINVLQSGNPLFVVTGITQFTGTTGSGALRPDLLQPVHPTGHSAQWFSNNITCATYTGSLAGILPPPAPQPALPDCATTPNAAFAVPCTFSNVQKATAATSFVLQPTTCHFGDLPRNAFTGPHFFNTDFSILKNTKLTERFTLQFRADFFDIFNQANFGNPTLNVQSGTFGDITSTRFPTGDSGSSRQLQFALKLLF